MCGLFGYLGEYSPVKSEVSTLKNHSVRRGQDSSGVVIVERSVLKVIREDSSITRLWKRALWENPSFIAGHSRLITNGHQDNQPVVRDGIVVLHNGIILNSSELWKRIEQSPQLEIDTEIICALIRDLQNAGKSLLGACESALSLIQGVANCIVLDAVSGEIAVMSNNGSLYIGEHKRGRAFSSEAYPLEEAGFRNIKQVKGAKSLGQVGVNGSVVESTSRRPRLNLVPQPNASFKLSQLPNLPSRDLRRCTICILPETMPFISFDANGICNYCENYRPQQKENRIDELENLLTSDGGADRSILFPFSGGRDSSFGLHVASQVMGLKPIAYTYDWGMVTDLGRRNMSLMCAKLGVEHIIVAANIAKKRENIRKNVIAWLRRPHLGMVNLFTAGDKHFFQHINAIQSQTRVAANLWSFNPLEATHFKTGFLGIPPDFANERVYRTGFGPQLRYLGGRTREVVRNPAYLNRSLWDTATGEYYRSIRKKNAYFQLFDFMPWREEEVEKTLDSYGWERADDTSTTWRIGDGTAAFYNFIFFALAGFTEHDTLRSNQVREGHISREMALRTVQEENQPRYQSIKWYLDAIGLDFDHVLAQITRAPQVPASG